MFKLMMRVFLVVATLAIFITPEVTLAETTQGATSTQQANAPNWTTGDQLKSSLDPKNMSEYSRKIYAVIFGSAGKIFGEADPSALGYVVGQFNIIAFVMGILVLLYLLVGGAINTAASGEMLGRSWSSAWIPIRVVMAFGLIIPTPLTAPYSPSQVAVLYAVSVGDTMATTVTKVAASKVAKNELKMAGGVTPPPASISVDIAGSAFCAANEWNVRTMNGERANNHVYAIAEYAEGPMTKSVKLTANAMPATYDIAVKNLSSIRFGSSGQCGSIDFATQSRINQALGSDMTSAESSYDEFNQVIINDLKFYAQFEAALRKEGLDSMALEAEMSSFEPAAESHSALISRYAGVVAEQANSLPQRLKVALHAGFGEVDPKSFIDREVRHYTDINALLHKMAQYSSAENGAMINALQGISNVSWNVCFANTDECKEKLNSESLAELYEGIKINSTMAGVTLISRGLAEGTRAGGSGGVRGSNLDGEIEPDKFMVRMTRFVKAEVLTVMGMAGGAISGSNQQGIAEDTSSMDFQLNPMVFLHNVGHALTGVAGIIIAAMTTTGALSTAASTSVITSTFGAGAAKGAFDVLMQFGVPATWALIFGGVSFTLISLVPIVIGVWGFISIIFMSIQGVAAAPFAVVLLATPGGEGVTNQTFQRFLLHLTHLLLAPMIFVLGAVASLAMIVVGGNIAIATFVNMSSFFGSDSWMVVIGTIFVFVIVMYYMVLKIAMTQLSMQNTIMEMLGGGFHKPMGDDVSGSVMATGDRMKGVVDGVSKGAKEVMNASRQRRNLPPIP